MSASLLELLTHVDYQLRRALCACPCTEHHAPACASPGRSNVVGLRPGRCVCAQVVRCGDSVHGNLWNIARFASKIPCCQDSLLIPLLCEAGVVLLCSTPAVFASDNAEAGDVSACQLREVILPHPRLQTAIHFLHQEIYVARRRYMVCKGFTKSLQVSEHLLGILDQAAQDEKKGNASRESTPCVSKHLTVLTRALKL